MKNIHIVLLLFLFSVPVVSKAQVNIDTVIINQSNIICYTSNNPQYARLMPPVKPLYVTLISSPEMNWSMQSPQEKTSMMKEYVNSFSLADAEFADIDKFLCYVTQLAISEPIKAPEYLESTSMVFEALTQNLDYRNGEVALVMSLLNDLSQWVESRNR